MAAKIIKVILKGEDWTFNKKYLIYDEVHLAEEADVLKQCIKDAKECLKMNAEDAEVKTSMVL